MEVDHINADGLDCRRANLRTCSHAENMQNRCHHVKAPDLRGVFWQPSRGKWFVQLRVHTVRRYIGSYASLDEAKAAAREARAHYFTHANEARHTGDADLPADPQQPLFARST
jgi:hypothetical protein